MITNTVFKTAEENMAYDIDLLETKNAALRLRTYVWPQPSVTLSKGKSLPPSLSSIDHSFRCTGGGIVFHSPGDLLFTVAGELDNPILEGKIKEKMQTVSTLIAQALGPQGCETNSFDDGEENIEYCSTYNTPYEIKVNRKKVVGIAMAKKRKSFILQCIIHCVNPLDVFSVPKDLRSKLPGACGQSALCVAAALTDLIKQKLEP